MPEIEEVSADELVRLFLGAPNGAESGRFLDDLVDKHAMPVIRVSLRSKLDGALSASEFDDLCSQACLSLVERLTAIRDEGNAYQIRDFLSYAAVIAYNTWHEHLNQASPNRRSLSNKIRYVLGKDSRLDVTRGEGEAVCSLTEGEKALGSQTVDDLAGMVSDGFADFRKATLPELLFEILTMARSGIRLNDLISIVAKLWAVEDKPKQPLDGFHENTIRSGGNGQRELEVKFELEHIWSEIRELPPNQRMALLYNLRDEKGREMLFVFYNSGIATLKQIADAMSLSADNFSHILPLLPFDDKSIAERMGITAKQVANLRKVARENLRRRIDGKPKRKRTEGGN